MNFVKYINRGEQSGVTIYAPNNTWGEKPKKMRVDFSDIFSALQQSQNSDIRIMLSTVDTNQIASVRVVLMNGESKDLPIENYVPWMLMDRKNDTVLFSSVESDVTRSTVLIDFSHELARKTAYFEIVYR